MADSVNSTALPDAPPPLTPDQLHDQDGEPRVLDLTIAERLGMADPHAIRRIIDRNWMELESYGVVRSTVDQTRISDAGSEIRGRGRPGKAYHLNEGQALVICALSRTPQAASVRRQIIDVFMAYRHGKLAPAALAAPAKTPNFPVTRDTTIIRFPEVHRRTGYHRTWLFRLEREGKFPKRVQLGTKSVGWIEEEVMAWIAGRQEGRSGEALPWLLVPPGGQVPAQATPAPAPEPVQAPTKRKRGRPPRLPAAPPPPIPRVERQTAPVDRPSLAADLLNGPDKIAAFLGLTVQQILTFASRNQIPAFWVGAQLLARKSTLTRWVADAEAAAFRTMAEVAELERHAAGTESPTAYHLSRQGDAP